MLPSQHQFLVILLLTYNNHSVAKWPDFCFLSLQKQAVTEPYYHALLPGHKLF